MSTKSIRMICINPKSNMTNIYIYIYIYDGDDDKINEYYYYHCYNNQHHQLGYIYININVVDRDDYIVFVIDGCIELIDIEWT